MSRKSAAPAAAIYFFILSAQFAFTYVPRHLTALGWSASAIGALLAANAISRSVAMPLWARYADSIAGHSRVARLLMAAAWLPICLLLLGWATDLDAGYLALIGVAITGGSALPLVDTHVIKERGREHFGRLRAWGSFGFGGAAIAFAVAGNQLTHVELAGFSPLIFGVLLAVAGLAAFGLAPSQADAEPVEAVGWRDALPKAMILPFALWVVHWMSQAPYNVFLVHLAEETGLPAWTPGVAVALGVGVEIAVLRLAGRTIDRFGAPTVFLICLIATAIRWAAMAACTSAALFVALQVLHGLTFGAFFLLVMRVLDENIPTERRGAAQAMLYVIVFGVGSALGQWGAGLALEALGSASSLFLGAAILEIALLIPALMWWRRG